MRDAKNGFGYTRTLAALIAATLAASADATAPTASSNAYDFSVDVSLATIPLLHIDPHVQVQFTDQATAYDNNDSDLTNFDTGLILNLADLKTSAVVAETQWIPGPSFLAVGSRATVNDLNLSLVGENSNSLLDIGADVVESTATIVGTCPQSVVEMAAMSSGIVDDFIFTNGFDLQGLTPASTSDAPGLGVTLGGTPLSDLPTSSDQPIVVDISILGIATGSLILNEQTVTGDGVTGLSIASNGLHLSVSIATTLANLDVDAIISHAEASITCH